MDSIRAQVGEGIFSTSAMHLVMTVPAIWSDHANQRMVKALQAVEERFSKSVPISLVSEPEAAAVAALQELDRHSMREHDSFVVVDAGGGTVDLITYTITALHPSLEVVEATEGTGGLCGSALVNERFAQFLAARVGGEEGWNEDVLHNALDTFENDTKRKFTLGSLARAENYSIPVRGLRLNQLAGITRNGRFTLKASEVHMLFEPDVLRIIQLVEEQIALCPLRVRAVILVGGYGSSTYVRERLQQALQRGGTSAAQMEILQPPSAWTAVVRGAVMKGLARIQPGNPDIPTVAARTARKHYGYEVNRMYDAEKHSTLTSKMYWDGCDGCWRVSVMEWVIRRGEQVVENKTFARSYQQTMPVEEGRLVSFTTSIYADNISATAPIEKTRNVEKLCALTADLRTIPEYEIDKKLGHDGRMYYVVHYDIENLFRGAMTEYTLIYKGKRYDTVTAEYV
ncbi:hypothetical protein GGR56DRAFT_645823 [Xylariaceae sp. FL0804]|nr:hypothetical protein GGR56DRAFT_645823 [Xylariaceae sp. FL0804]